MQQEAFAFHQMAVVVNERARFRDTSASPPPVGVSPFGKHAAPAFDVNPSDDASSVHSFADSHRVNRGWIAECLWWLSTCRRRRYQSDYEVLFVNGSNRFGSNSCRLSGKGHFFGPFSSWNSSFGRFLNMAVVSEGSLTPYLLPDDFTDDSSFESERDTRARWWDRWRLALTRMRLRRRLRSTVSEYEVLIRGGDDLVGSNVLPLSGDKGFRVVSPSTILCVDRSAVKAPTAKAVDSVLVAVVVGRDFVRVLSGPTWSDDQ